MKKTFRAGPIILIILGGVFLLNNFGILPWDIWTHIWKFWPVLLILIGIEFLLGQSFSFRTLIVLGLLIFLVPVIFLFNPLTNNPLASEKLQISQDLKQLTRSKVIIDFPATRLEIGSLATSSAKLVEGEVDYSKAANKPTTTLEEKFGQSIFHLQQDAQPGLPLLSSVKNTTKLSLTRQIPLEFQIKTAASQQLLDFSNLRADYLEIDTQASDLKIILSKAYSSQARIKAKASNLLIEIPKELPARIKIDSKVKNLSIDSRFKNNGSEYKSENFDQAFIRADIQIEALTGSITIK